MHRRDIHTALLWENKERLCNWYRHRSSDNINTDLNCDRMVWLNSSGSWDGPLYWSC